MGWKLKAGAVFIALLFLGAGAWIVSLLIFAALLLPGFARGSRRSSSEDSGGSRRFPFRQALGAFLLFLSLVAFADRGTISPLVFGGLGVLLLLWNQVRLPSFGGSLRPVKGSILLRGALVPFRWTALIEVKPITRELGNALSGIGEPMVVRVSGTPSIHLVVSRIALSEGSAEEAILKAVERMGRGVVPHGAYLLPVDSSQASSLLGEALQREEVSEKGWGLALSTGAYDVLSIEPSRGSARSLGIYRRVQGAARSTVPTAGVRFVHPPLLWEVFKSLEGRVQWPNPDGYTSFLSSIYATGYEPLGSSIIDAGTPSPTSETVLVRSHSSPAVTLSRPQLRAIMAIYARGPPIVEGKEPISTPDREAVPAE